MLEPGEQIKVCGSLLVQVMNLASEEETIMFRIGQSF